MARTLYRNAALADGTGPELRLGISLLVDHHRIEWIRPSDGEPDPGPASRWSTRPAAPSSPASSTATAT